MKELFFQLVFLRLDILQRAALFSNATAKILQVILPAKSFSKIKSEELVKTNV